MREVRLGQGLSQDFPFSPPVLAMVEVRLAALSFDGHDDGDDDDFDDCDDDGDDDITIDIHQDLTLSLLYTNLTYTLSFNPRHNQGVASIIIPTY